MPADRTRIPRPAAQTMLALALVLAVAAPAVPQVHMAQAQPGQAQPGQAQSEQAQPEQPQSELAQPEQAPCLHQGREVPHGTRVGLFVCVNGSWVRGSGS